MNWIDYSKERPEPEPKRQVLVLRPNGSFDTCPAWHVANDPDVEITHWAEIEPPTALSFDELEKKYLKPDPFEEWWNSETHFLQVPVSDKNLKERDRKTWDAAVKHREGIKS